MHAPQEKPSGLLAPHALHSRNSSLPRRCFLPPTLAPALHQGGYFGLHQKMLLRGAETRGSGKMALSRCLEVKRLRSQVTHWLFLSHVLPCPVHRPRLRPALFMLTRWLRRVRASPPASSREESIFLCVPVLRARKPSPEGLQQTPLPSHWLDGVTRPRLNRA